MSWRHVASRRHDVTSRHDVTTVPRQCHLMTHGGGGSRLGQKSVTYYLNGPLSQMEWSWKVLFDKKFLSDYPVDAKKLMQKKKFFRDAEVDYQHFSPFWWLLSLWQTLKTFRESVSKKKYFVLLHLNLLEIYVEFLDFQTHLGRMLNSLVCCCGFDCKMIQSNLVITITVITNTRL
jgi:hypothetical protein